MSPAASDVAVRATAAQLDAAAARVLAGIAGPQARPRADQLAAAAALAVDGRRALVVQATGWGKSAVYWMAARALRDAGGGPTLVVAARLAVVRDQVEAAMFGAPRMWQAISPSAPQPKSKKPRQLKGR